MEFLTWIKSRFQSNLDTLFSKTEKYYKLPKGDEFFDERQSKYTIKDTLYHIYRISPKSLTEGTFRFKNLDIKPKEVVDFYADHSLNFRKMEVSVYMNDKQYQELRAGCKDFKDITPENVRKVNNGKYVILQSVNDMRNKFRPRFIAYKTGKIITMIRTKITL